MHHANEFVDRANLCAVNRQQKQLPGTRTENMALPIIDFSPFLDPASGPTLRRKTALEIDQACRDVGFFYLSNHGIDAGLMQTMLHKARTFFEEASQAEKEGLAIRGAGDLIGDSCRGYQRVDGGVKGVHEVARSPSSLARRQLIGFKLIGLGSRYVPPCGELWRSTI